MENVQIQLLKLSDAKSGDDCALLALRDNNDRFGLGEITLPAGVSGASALQLVRASAARLATTDLRNINVALDAVSSVTDQDANVGRRVRAAFDSAIHDLNGKLRGCPVHMMLGGCYRDEVALSQRIPSGAQVPYSDKIAGAVLLEYRPEPSRQASSFGPASAAGWLAAAIARLGPAVQVDIDANGLFDNPALARTFIEGLLEDGPRLNIGLLQPLDDADLVGHATLCATLPIPVILDGSVRSAKVMGQIVQLAAADRIVLNIDRVGGLRAAMQVVSIAESASIGISSASFARTAVGVAATLHLAAVLHDTFPARLDHLEADKDEVAVAGFTIAAGIARVSTVPGLGVVLKDDTVARFQNVV